MCKDRKDVAWEENGSYQTKIKMFFSGRPNTAALCCFHRSLRDSNRQKKEKKSTSAVYLAGRYWFNKLFLIRWKFAWVSNWASWLAVLPWGSKNPIKYLGSCHGLSFVLFDQPQIYLGKCWLHLQIRFYRGKRPLKTVKWLSVNLTNRVRLFHCTVLNILWRHIRDQ